MERKKLKFLGGFGFILLILSFIIFILQPKSFYHFSDTFDRWNAHLIRNILHQTRRYIDPCFKDNVYITERSRQPIDVIIPMVEKDLITARESIKSIRAMIFHPIHVIYLVAPESTAIRQLAQEMGCTFVLENKTLKEFEQIKAHGGWVLQQFIKLNADEISGCEDILVVDADTIFLRPQVFIDNNTGRYTFHIHNDFSSQRKQFTRDLLKTSTYFKLDFVTHHMLINRTMLRKLKEKIERHFSLPWYQALLSKLKGNHQGFSEYDIYATYFFLEKPEATRLLSSANTFIYRDRFAFFKDYFPIYSADYKSISSHSFMNFECS